METHVYANGNEFCSRAAYGLSTAAFPDPCWSPPTPSAGPVLIPYSNTAFARDLENGSTSVFVCGTPIAKKDHSHQTTPQYFDFQGILRRSGFSRERLPG